MSVNTNSHPVPQRSAHRIPAARHGATRKEAPENRIRLVLLDEHSLFRESLSRFLASEARFEVVGEGGAAAEALEILKSSTVDVMLLDFDIRTEHGEDIISAAHQAGYQGRFLIVTGAPDVQKSAMALKRGASGIFLKSEAPERLIQAIRLVANGEL
jgi:two-component system, NarL family, nitrate/nitrite response regulator NarL